MCVICVKNKGVEMPTEDEIRAMWARNPDGAGFAYARDGVLHIEKGFMTLRSFLLALDVCGISKDESAILHFRISTQAGVNPEMCHPFPVSSEEQDMERLEVIGDTDVAIAHNGIIRLTTNRKAKQSDTAIFTTRFVSALVQKPSDLEKAEIRKAIEVLAPGNRFAFLDKYGAITLIGDFSEIDGLYYSNLYHIATNKWLF